MIERFIKIEDIEKEKEHKKFSRKNFDQLTKEEKDELLKQIAKKLNMVS